MLCWVLEVSVNQGHLERFEPFLLEVSVKQGHLQHLELLLCMKST